MLFEKWKSLSHVRLCHPMDYAVHRVLQARILEWVACSLLQGIFPILGLNPGLLYCRQIIYHLSPRKPICCVPGTHIMLHANYISKNIYLLSLLMKNKNVKRLLLLYIKTSVSIIKTAYYWKNHIMYTSRVEWNAQTQKYGCIFLNSDHVWERENWAILLSDKFACWIVYPYFKIIRIWLIHDQTINALESIVGMEKAKCYIF